VNDSFSSDVTSSANFVNGRPGAVQPLPEEMAKDAIAHEEAVGSDKVRMTFRVILGRQQAEARHQY